jgi:hypothetical protein
VGWHRHVGGGTPGINFAWTNGHDKPPYLYHDLNVAGMKAHAELHDEFGATARHTGGFSNRLGVDFVQA